MKKIAGLILIGVTMAMAYPEKDLIDISHKNEFNLNKFAEGFYKRHNVASEDKTFRCRELIPLVGKIGLRVKEQDKQKLKDVNILSCKNQYFIQNLESNLKVMTDIERHTFNSISNNMKEDTKKFKEKTKNDFKYLLNH